VTERRRSNAVVARSLMGATGYRVLGAILACAITLLGADAVARDAGHLWRISRAGTPDSFVLGTIHVADPRVATPAPAVLDALGRSRVLAVELVPEPADARLVELELFDDGTSLSSLVGPQLFAMLGAELERRGLPRERLERMKPWAAMMHLGAARQPQDGATSLDTELLVAAQARRIRVQPLELLDEQIAAFDTIPMDSQVALLGHAIVHREALAASLEPMVAAWQRGDFDALDRLAGASHAGDPAMSAHHRRMMKSLVANRTVLMHHRLQLPLREGRVFVAVGAMHLPGREGLLAMLRADGYRLSRLW
jgi:uncharacterized protein YbaP (TraB family)